MAQPKASSSEPDWLHNPIANRYIAAFILGRAFNRCRFHLRQAFLLYGGKVEAGGENEFYEAVKIVDVMLKRDSEFASEQWAPFEYALQKVRATWMQYFGSATHQKFLERLANEMENKDEFIQISEEDEMTFAGYRQTLQDRNWEWEKDILRDCRLWLDEFRKTILGCIGRASQELFNLGELLDQSIRPADVKPGTGHPQFEDDLRLPAKYREYFLFHRYGTVACHPGEQPPAETWADNLNKSLRRVELQSLIKDLKKISPYVSDQQMRLVAELHNKIQLALEKRPDEAVSSDTGTASGTDESNYVLASTLWPDKFDSYRKFLAFLSKHPIRTKKPMKNRLFVHAGDFTRCNAEIEKERDALQDDDKTSSKSYKQVIESRKQAAHRKKISKNQDY